ncbi:MAG TPA: histidine phosphatase family protein [Ignavibacteriaceae bacterium]|nr:histidine phosphatase family protein [Ignavibacteriaceae bacterium]
MNLYLVRHSIAENISIDKKDFDRELTEEGKFVIKKTSAAWKSYVKNVDVVLSSPLIRAAQTAEIIALNFQGKPRVIKDNLLGTGSRTADLIELLNAMEYKNVVVVGHQPDLSIHINNFCGTGSFNLAFPPASLAKIEFDNNIKYGKGRLIYFIPPLVHW